MPNTKPLPLRLRASALTGVALVAAGAALTGLAACTNKKAEASVEKAHAAVVKAAEDAEGWGPERVIDAAKEWEVARNVYRHWHSVAYVIREQGKSPEAALVEVAKAVAADIVSNALHGARTSDEARSMIYKASERGSGVFLRSAGYIVREIADLYRY